MEQNSFDLALEQAHNLKQAGNWSAAAEIYQTLYASDIGKSNPRVIFSLLYCLKKLENYALAVEIGLPACALEGIWDSIPQTTAWCIYYQYFRSCASLPPDQAVPWLEKIRQIHPLRSGLHPLPLSVFSYLSQATGLNPTLVIQICHLLDPALLDSTPQPGSKPGSFYPSALEKYVNHLSKALFANEQFQDCINLCQQTLDNCAALSTNQEIWLKRRIALCLAKLGNYPEALAIYRQLVLRKPEWFILYETALAAYRIQDYVLALQMAVKAATAVGEVDVKIHLWELLKSLMAQNRKPEQAVSLLKLCAAIRYQRHWHLGQDLMAELSSYNIVPDSLPPFKAIYSQCRPWIQDLLFDPAQALTGWIDKVFPHGKAGFIKAGPNSYYFQAANCSFPPAELRPGLKVSFHAQPSFDPKKQQDSLAAVNIKKQ